MPMKLLNRFTPHAALSYVITCHVILRRAVLRYVLLCYRLTVLFVSVMLGPTMVDGWTPVVH